MTQAALAQQIGVTNSAICQYERGCRAPNVFTLLGLAKCFGMTLDELVPPRPEVCTKNVEGQLQIDIEGD